MSLATMLESADGILQNDIAALKSWFVDPGGTTIKLTAPVETGVKTTVGNVSGGIFNMLSGALQPLAIPLVLVLVGGILVLFFMRKV
jgi:hypothetical protein